MTLTPQLSRQELAKAEPVARSRGRSAGSHQWVALTAVCIATFIVLTDFMAVGVALPAVQKSFNASFAQLQWVVEAFVVALAAGVLAAGYVADRTGRGRVFLAGSAVFACGSVIGGLAPSAYILIGARAAQGLGGALLLATGSVLLADVFREAHGRAASVVWGTATGLAIALSPLVGGVITSYLGWRWIFFIAAASACVALVVGAMAIGERAPARAGGQSSDWRGLLLFTAAIVILVIGLVKTTTTLGGWAQSGVLACFGCGGLLLIAFVAVEVVSPAPVLDVSLFRRRTFTGSAIAAFGLSMAVLGPFIFLVLYLSYDLGYSTLNIGDHLFILSGMTLLLLPLTRTLERHIPVKVIICAGLALVGAGLWLMSRLPSNPKLEDLVPGLIVAGVGLELVNPRLASTSAAAVRAKLGSALAASRASSTFRQLGTAIGVAVLGSVFAARLTDEISSHIATFGAVSGQAPQIADLLLEGRTAAAIGSTPPGVRSAMLPIVQQSFTGAMHEVLLIAAIVAGASAVLALSIRSRDLPRPGPRAEQVEIVPVLTTAAVAEVAPAELVPAGRAPAQLVGAEVLPPEILSVSATTPEAVPVEAVPVEAVPVEVVPSEEVPTGGVPIELTASDLLSSEVISVELPAVEATRAPVGSGRINGVRKVEPGDGTIEVPVPAGDATGHMTETTEANGAPAEPPGGPSTIGGAWLAGDAGTGLSLLSTGTLAIKVSNARNGRPVKAEVALVSAQTEVVARHWTGQDGEFILPALEGGEYVLVVQSVGYRSETAPVVVTHGKTGTIELALVGLAHIYGAVTEPGGGWLPGVPLTLTDGSGVIVASTVTDDAGSYHFSGVPEGSYTLAAPENATATMLVDIGPGAALALDVALGHAQGDNGGTVRERPLVG